MQRSFFEHVLDAFEGFVDEELGEVHARAHGRGLKVWFGPAEGRAAREHFEAQLIRLDGSAALEIGFHAEHSAEADNQGAIERLDSSASWRAALGDGVESGPFLGMDGWRRISEIWDPPDPDDPEAPIEIAARLAEFVGAIEPVRRATLTR